MFFQNKKPCILQDKMYNKYKDIFKCIFIKCDRYLNLLPSKGPFFATYLFLFVMFVLL